MEDFRIIYRMLQAILSMETLEKPDVEALLSPEVLKTSQEKRDALALKLLSAGYIEGLRLITNIDGQKYAHILWKHSAPTVTLRGLEYLEENSLMKKAKDLAKGIVEIVT